MIHSLSIKSSLKSIANNTIYGEPSIRMEKSWMFFLQARHNGAAAKRFLKQLLRSHGDEPRKIATDTSQYANNRAECSHQSTWVRERGMRKFKSPKQAQRLLSVHAAVYNLFNLGPHLIGAEHYRTLRIGSFKVWNTAA